MKELGGCGMYLKRLEIIGFKSFADRTEFEFVPGVTAVVGPNGSGKSNVSDAIRWVLGEQSAKTLRGAKMEDIIFSGSDSRKPVNYCEVSLTLDNTDGQLRPGMFCRVELVKHRYEEAVSIPLYAVISRRKERFVYIVNDSKAHYRRVELGVLDGWQVQITDGLKPGDRVIIVGHRSLEDGQKIIIQRTVQDPAELEEPRGP